MMILEVLLTIAMIGDRRARSLAWPILKGVDERVVRRRTAPSSKTPSRPSTARSATPNSSARPAA